jgi:molybdenum cofactor biosynthesis protein B
VGLEEHRRAGQGSFGFAVVTVSDTRDANSDRGGAYLVEALEGAGHRVARRALVRDEVGLIRAAVSAAVEDAAVELVLLTGGTGIAPRDVTPEALAGLLERELPGFGELFRQLSFQEIGSAAILSRALGGVIGRKVVLALPGSPKALRLAMQAIVLPEAGHLIAQARGPT